MGRTPEQVIEKATRWNPYSSLDLTKETRATKIEMEYLMDVRSKVLAALGRFSEEEQAIIKLWSWGYSYRAIARAIGKSDRTVRRIWDRVWPAMVKRLEELDLVQQGFTGD